MNLIGTSYVLVGSCLRWPNSTFLCFLRLGNSWDPFHERLVSLYLESRNYLFIFTILSGHNFGHATVLLLYMQHEYFIKLLFSCKNSTGFKIFGSWAHKQVVKWVPVWWLRSILLDPMPTQEMLDVTAVVGCGKLGSPTYVDSCLVLEIKNIKTTSMEDVSTRVLEKIKNI